MSDVTKETHGRELLEAVESDDPGSMSPEPAAESSDPFAQLDEIISEKESASADPTEAPAEPVRTRDEILSDVAEARQRYEESKSARQMVTEASLAGIDTTDTAALREFAEKREVVRLSQMIEEKQAELGEPLVDALEEAEYELLDGVEEALDAGDEQAVWDAYRDAQQSGVDTSEVLQKIAEDDWGLAQTLVVAFGQPRQREISYDNVGELVAEAQSEIDRQDLRGTVAESLQAFGSSEHAEVVRDLTRQALLARDDEGRELIPVPRNPDEARATIEQIGRTFDKQLREERSYRSDPFSSALAGMDVRLQQSADDTPDAPNRESDLRKGAHEKLIEEQMSRAMPRIVREATGQTADADEAFLRAFDEAADERPTLSGRDDYAEHVKGHRAAEAEERKSVARGRLQANETARRSGLEGLSVETVAELRRVIEGE